MFNADGLPSHMTRLISMLLWHIVTPLCAPMSLSSSDSGQNRRDRRTPGVPPLWRALRLPRRCWPRHLAATTASCGRQTWWALGTKGDIHDRVVLTRCSAKYTVVEGWGRYGRWNMVERLLCTFNYTFDFSGWERERNRRRVKKRARVGHPKLFRVFIVIHSDSELLTQPAASLLKWRTKVFDVTRLQRRTCRCMDVCHCLKSFAQY